MIKEVSGFVGYSFKNKRQFSSKPIRSVPCREKTLLEVLRDCEGSTTEIVEKSKTIFFPGDPAKKLYLIKNGAVRLSRIYENGEEITVSFLKKNSLFGVSSLSHLHESESFYHASAFTRVEMETAPAKAVLKAIETDTTVGILLIQGLSGRILQSASMIETLKSKDTYSRLISFLLVLSRDFGVASTKGITIDLRITQEAIAEAIGSTRVTITRLFVDLRRSGVLDTDRQKITIIDPTALTKCLN